MVEVEEPRPLSRGEGGRWVSLRGARGLSCGDGAYLELDVLPELPEEPVFPDDDEPPELEPDDDELEPLPESEPPLLLDEPPPLPPLPPPPLRFHRSVRVEVHDADASRCACCCVGMWNDVRSVLSGMATAETVVSSNATAAKTRFNFMIWARLGGRVGGTKIRYQEVGYQQMVRVSVRCQF